MKKAVAFIILLSAFTAVGSVKMWAIVPYIVMAYVAIVTVLVVLNKIEEKHYPFYIFGLSLSLIWQTSMIGTYIVGVDIHSEYYVVNEVLRNGWNPDWINVGNTSVILVFLSPLLSNIGLDVIWQFKALFPFVCAFVPVILYFAFKNIFGNKRAYFSSLFFMIMPMFTMEVVSMVKSQWAYLCLAGMVYFFTSQHKYKAVYVGLLAVGTILAHYTVGIIAMFYLIGIVIVLSVMNIGKIKIWFKHTIPVKQMVLSTICVVVVFCTWFSFAGNGFMLNQVKSVGSSILLGLSINSTSQSVSEPSPSPSTPNPDSEYKELVKDYIVNQTVPTNDSYFGRQPPMIRSAIGMDFVGVSVWGKVFRILQYLTELLLVIGFIFLILKRKRYNLTAEYIAGVVCSFILLACSVFVPYFNVMTVTTTRMYAITLFFIAPLLVVGVESLIGRMNEN
jgi:uncharacterized membrane protein